MQQARSCLCLLLWFVSLGWQWQHFHKARHRASGDGTQARPGRSGCVCECHEGHGEVSRHSMGELWHASGRCVVGWKPKVGAEGIDEQEDHAVHWW